MLIALRDTGISQMALFQSKKKEPKEEHLEYPPPDSGRVVPNVMEHPCPKVGVVIGTYAAVPYVALQMAARERFWPDVPLLIHDDSSQSQSDLQQLCVAHQADFVSTAYRLAPTVGDMNSIVSGLEWGRNLGLDIVVKLSRRCILGHNWVPGLQELAYNSQYSTYSNACVYYDFPFRSECIAMHVGSWFCSGAHAELKTLVEQNQQVAEFLEKWYHRLVLRIHSYCAPSVLRRYEKLLARNASGGGYGVWHMLGMGRHARVPGILWHDTHSPEDYYNYALSLGLTNYRLDDFLDPNMNQGNGM